MAKVLFSTAVGELRNKVGGAVFTKTRFGPMVRSKVSPTQPRTTYQMDVRAGFTRLAKLWSDPTMDDYRAGWIGLAVSYPVKDVFGSTQNLTGLQMFMRLNRALQTVEEAELLIPPTSLIAAYPGALTLVATGAPVTVLTVQPATYATALDATLIYATPGLSMGRATAGARFRLVHMVSGVIAAPIDILAKYTTKFGAPILGRNMFVRVVYTTLATGAQSLPSQASIMFPLV